MRVLLIEIPFPSFSFNEHCPIYVNWLGNNRLSKMETFPSLGLGYLASTIITDKKLNEQVEIDIWGNELTNFIGESALLRRIESFSPNIIGFTVFIWNYFIILDLIKKIKTVNDQIIFILGGPEVSVYSKSTSAFLDNNVIIVKGEGEFVFKEIIKILLKNHNIDNLKRINNLIFQDSKGKIVETKNNNNLIDLNSIPSPYLSGIFDLTRFNQILLETYRGCNSRCIYCYYHKSFPTIREFNLKRIQKEVKLCLEYGIDDIYIIDATFNEQTRIKEILECFIDINQSKSIEFFTEIQAELITPKIAELFYKSNFPFMEIGLQTINEKVLKIIRRSFNRNRFQENIKILKNQDIAIGGHVIIGLPYDDFNGVKSTIKYLDDLNFDKIFPYLLYVLPGTELFKNSNKYGIKFMQTPPYFIIKTSNFSKKDIYQAFNYAMEYIQKFDNNRTENKFIKYYQERMNYGI